MRIVRWGLVLGCIACGDNVHPEEDLFVPLSGTRLALQSYRYDDGTEQAEPNEFFDTDEHASCRPQLWSDDIVRCVPVAEDAVFIDATCTELVGRRVEIDNPTHFIGFDKIGERLLPVRIYRAGGETDPVAEFYEKQDGVCAGPFPNPETIVAYYELVGEIDPTGLVTVRDGELGEGRLGLRVRESDDGMRVPFGLRDRDLDLACTPRKSPDGVTTCEPSDVAVASHFLDPRCDEPVIVIDETSPIPAIAAIVESSGCTSHHAVGREVSPPLYRRSGDACIPSPLSPMQRSYAVEAAIELAPLERTLEAKLDRRLQRFIVSIGPSDAPLRFVDDRLFDTAIRGECRRLAIDDVTRCVPATAAPATTLFTAGCAVEVRVAELPLRMCERPTFAIATVEDIVDVHAIGDPVSNTVFQRAGQCVPYTSSPGTVMHALGPPLDPTTFMGALYFGER